MPITTVDVVVSDGGTAQIINGDRVGDSSRSVRVQAVPSPGYKFDGWQITIDDTNTGGGGGGGGGGSDPNDFAI